MDRSPIRKGLIGLAGTLIVLLIVGFSPLVNADTGWKNTLGSIVWWAIIVVAVALLVLGGIDVLRRRRRPAQS